MKECRKDKLLYKMEAVKCMGNIMEEYKIDHFKELWEIFSPVLLKVRDLLMLFFLWYFCRI